MLKKFTAVLLTVIICFSLSLPAYAASGDTVDSRIAYLESAYGILIDYSLEQDGSPCIGTGALGNLEMALAAMTPGVISRVSAYINDSYGHNLNFYFVLDSAISLTGNVPDGQTALGALDTQTGVIYLVVPSRSRGTFASGDSPLTAAHEVGHIINMMLSERYGAGQLESEWVALNGGYGYKGQMSDNTYNDTTFFSEYASTTYEEDFAETFGHSVTRNRAGLGYYYLLTNEQGGRTNLGRKIDFLTTLLADGIPGSQNLIANIGYTSTYTAANLYWQDQRFYGIKLQYAGCSYPRYVLSGLAGTVGIDVAESVWITEIGGWYVTAMSGEDYFIFPEGYVEEARTAVNLLAG